ncbi:HisA/HisF-related TIM barrel protein [Fulvimarina sp. 2208YS6-2-32]|uniref:HisA/HisF-related TIM barrel protein n=1 Tax=Fulvimarina uroteuthidis TaxID=3098149 RepID=A0ABU5HY96_9HYPH|nr:HisA/HisF-related TIM barrel protein [Fulvimarina sp. 2208YS6-2-32]MDY8108104.1 HisA/HisF-related TIM barrel protein [Fulvimarina sp. 2208YS6-2-32]
MRLIPVLDLKEGLVVRGKGGDRESYRPIETPLAPSAEPIDVAAGLLEASGATTLYIADLDAIMHGRAQADVLTCLIATFPTVTFWIDAGFRSLAEAHAFGVSLRLGEDENRIVPVLGSETLGQLGDLSMSGGAGIASGASRSVLSLDFDGAGFRGPSGLLDRSDLWPDDIIVMTLAKVGSNAGPDLGRLRQIGANAGSRNVFAAGGVRGPEDLAALQGAGVAGALVASALHGGSLAG